MNKKNNIEIIKYIIVGGITTLINLLLLKIFIDRGIYYILSNIYSYLIAVVINYLFNKKFVFKQKKINRKKENIQFIKFILLRVSSLFIDNYLFYIMVSKFFINIYVSRIFLTLFIIVSTYTLNKLFIFKREELINE